MAEPSPPTEWQLITNHARALLVIARHPDVRQIDVAQRLDITERTASTILSHLCDFGYLTKHRQLGDAVDARRNRYEIIDDVTLHDPFVRHRTVGEFVAFIDGDADTTRLHRRPSSTERHGRRRPG